MEKTARDFFFNEFVESIFRSDISQINENNFRVRFIGDLSAFEKNIKDKIEIIQNKSNSNKGIVITLALNYGGRLDIISAINKILIHNQNFN